MRVFAVASALVLVLSVPALVSAQSLYDDPRPKKQFSPTLTPPPAPPVELVSLRLGGCAASTRMECAPKSVARERAVTSFEARKAEPAPK